MSFLGLHKIERIAIDASISHFLLMFGYKLFSAYFSLFLLDKGLSLPKIGYAYFTIYIAMALFAIIAGGLAHRFNLALLSSIGILGYAIYSVAMYFGEPAYFPFFQVILGISAALFMVSSRVMLMRAKLHNHDVVFGWFSSAPIYAEVAAPVIGGLLIYQFGFPGVFIASGVIYGINIFFNFHTLFRPSIHKKDLSHSREIIRNYTRIFRETIEKKIFRPLAVGMGLLIIEGFYGAFLILFLREFLGFSQATVILYVSVWSITFIPISLFAIRTMEKMESGANLFKGGLIYGFATLTIGLFGAGFNFYTMLITNVFKSFGGFLTSSSRSGIMSRSFPEHPEEAGALDTLFSPLGVGIGALLGGFIVHYFNYQSLFIAGGIFVLFLSLMAKFYNVKASHEKIV